MLKKSVETRDWLHSLEPRTVRAVMKRVVEEITYVDSQVSTVLLIAKTLLLLFMFYLLEL